MANFRGGKSGNASKGVRGSGGNSRGGAFEKPKRSKSIDNDQSKDYKYGTKKRDTKFA